MKKFTKIVGILLCILTVVSCFAGCSASSKNAEEITDKTLLIAYTEECKPFLYTEDGKLTGFDVEVFDAIFDSIKNDYKDYKFVQVPEDYKIGEEPAVDGYTAYIMAGGVQKNTGSINHDCSFTENVIEDRVITVTAKGSKISAYTDLSGVKLGAVKGVAEEALNKNQIFVKNNKVKAYDDAAKALADLKSGKMDAVVVDEFCFNVADGKDSFTALDGELDTIEYGYAFKKWDWYVDSINQAIKELQSPDYNDADEFTPIVEKYFGYDASNFEYTEIKK